MSTLALLLQRSLEHEADLVRQFVQVLQVEALALSAPDDDKALQVSSMQKSHFSGLLDEAARRRQALLADLGFSADKAGLDAAAARYPALEPARLSLYELAAKASRLNTQNGATIDTYLRHNEQALNDLRAAAGAGGLYTASGRAQAVDLKNTTRVKAG